MSLSAIINLADRILGNSLRAQQPPQSGANRAQNASHAPAAAALSDLQYTNSTATRGVAAGGPSPGGQSAEQDRTVPSAATSAPSQDPGPFTGRRLALFSAAAGFILSQGNGTNSSSAPAKAQPAVTGAAPAPAATTMTTQEATPADAAIRTPGAAAATAGR